MSLSNLSTTGTKSSSNKSKIQFLNELKTKISTIYNEEYEENFNQILNFSEDEFFSQINKRVNSIIFDSFTNIREEDNENIKYNLKDLETEKKIIYKKDYNFLDSQFKSYFKEHINKNSQTKDFSKSERSNLLRKPLQLNQIQKVNEKNPLEGNIQEIFQFLTKNEKQRNFCFRKHCLFNKNHALHACYEDQLKKLNSLKTTTNSYCFKNVNLENANFFLPLYESSYKSYINRISIDQFKGSKTSRNTISLNSSYINFISNARKSNGDFNDKYEKLKKSFIKENDNTFDKNNTTDKIKYLICLLCKKVYNLNSILMYCDFCSLPFYTCLQENNEELIYPATWEKYHCGAIVNEQMKCLKCNFNLNINTNSNKLICNKCNLISDPLKIKWKCLVCNDDFKSNAKIYNPLEFKLIKFAIKYAILNKIPILPEEIDCCMDIREKIIKSCSNSYSNKNTEKFYLRHKNDCQGFLYEGSLYNRKVVVCSECKTFVNYEKFIWFCPFCNKSYRKRNSNFETSDKNKYKENKEKINSYLVKNNKDENDFDSNKNIKSDLDFGTLNNYSQNIKPDIAEPYKNQASQQIKFDKNVEKEQLKFPYRLSNVSKVININTKDNDKPIFDRLKCKFNNNCNFSTSFGSFISKEVNNKRSPFIKEAFNNLINLNFSVNDIKDSKNDKNPLNFSNIAFDNIEKERTNSTNKNETNYINILNSDSNSNNDSSNNLLFQNNKSNNAKLKIMSLKGIKINNRMYKSDIEISLKDKKHIFIDDEDKENCMDFIEKNNVENYDDSTFNNNSLIKQETIKSKFKNESEKLDLYEIVKDDNQHLNNCDYEIKMEKDEINFNNKKNGNYKTQNLTIDFDDSANDNQKFKYTITPSVKNSKTHFNSFFENYNGKKNLNIEKNEKKNFNFSINFDQSPNDLSANGFIYSRKSLILKKNSNNKNENYIEKFSPISNIFKKENVIRIKNRIYLKSIKLNQNLFETAAKDDEESNQNTKYHTNISDNLYIPGKQKMQIKKDPNLSPKNNSKENNENKTQMQNFSVEILYKTDDTKDIFLNSFKSIDKLESSDRKNSNDKNNYKTNLSSKIKRDSSFNSNNNLNDLSTSSISHNNKLMNCYYSKKSSDNELFSNFNNSSSKMNYYNNNDKDSNNVVAEDLNNSSKINILRHQSLIFTKRQKNLSNNDILNVQNNQKDNLIQNLEKYFCNKNSEIENDNKLKNFKANKNLENDNSNKSSNYLRGFINKRNSMYTKNFDINKFNANLENNSKNYFVDSITENIESEFSNSSGLISSSQIESNGNSNNINIRKESKKIIQEFAKKNIINSTKSITNSNNFNFHFLNNKDGGVINEIIDEDLLELEHSCTKSNLRRSINFNTNDKQNCSLTKENFISNNEFKFNSSFDKEEIIEANVLKKKEQIEIIYKHEGNVNKFTTNSFEIYSNKDFSLNLNEKLKNIKIDNNEFYSEANEDNLDLIRASNYNNQIISYSKKSKLRKNLKSSPDEISNYHDSYHKEIFDITNFTCKKENSEFIEFDSNIENSEKRKSNKKVDFVESEIILSVQSPNKLEIKYEIINYDSPLSTKKADFNNSYVKNSIKSSSQILIVNIGQNNNYMVDEDNINFLIEDFTFNLDDYIMEKSIGEGSFGSVFSATNKFNFKKYAIKKIIVDDISHINNIVSEIRILSKFNHKNIIQIYGMFFKKLDETTFALYILMEIGLMDWESQIKSKQINKVLYSEMELIEMLKQITSCLSFLQQNNISHRDIKPNNIMIFNESRVNSKSNIKNLNLIKVSDFGEARVTQGNNTNKLYTIKGTELFMSPKLAESYQNIQKEVDHNPYKSDCFSLGLCLLYAASLNLNSVYDIRNEILENRWISGSINKYLKLKFTKKFIDLLTRMLNIDENKRFDFIELNEFLKKY